MIRSVSTRLSLAAVLLLALPATAAAQEPPESTDWHRAQDADGGDLVSVPWFVEATLRLESGDATGSGGCNGFTGSYELEGESLRVVELGSTVMGCSDPMLGVEDGYLAALPDVASWTVADVGDGRTMHLRDAAGNDLLIFETPALGLTRSAVRGLAAELDELRSQVDRHEERIDNIRIGTLRERIKTLEQQVRTLRAQRDASSSDSSGSADTSAMNAAERVLLGAVRADIAKTCEPRRTQNPAGTIAALQCQPNAPEVRDMAYYLMESDDAWKVYRRRMQDNEVRNGTENRACAFNKPSQMAWVGGGIVNAGCYRDDNGRANLRFVNTLADCRQLTAGAIQVKSPSIYIAVLGPDRDIASLWSWAASSTDWEAGEDLFDPIKQPGQPWSDQCPHG